jgi:hypothetical protein
METIDRETKPHNNYDVMHDLYVVKKMKAKEIADLLHISTKLVDLKIREHGLFV